MRFNSTEDTLTKQGKTTSICLFKYLIQRNSVLVFIGCFDFCPTDELKSNIHSHFSSVIALQGNICVFNCFMLSC